MSRLPEIANRDRQPDPSDMSDGEWEVLQGLLPGPKGFGHPRTVNLREMINAIFYLQRSGCQWEMLPHDFPPDQTVYSYFRKWQRRGIWQRIHAQLRERLREQMGTEEDSTVAIADSQSVKTTEKSAPPALRFPQRQDGASRGRSTAMMVARKLKAVNAISS
jgi:putative transposase